MRSNTITEKPIYNGLAVKASPGYGLHTEILQDNERVMREALHDHSKVFAIMLTVKHPDDREYATDNKNWSRAVKSVVGKLERKKLDPLYAWCIEKNHGDVNHHYHMLMLLNGHKTQDARGHRSMFAKTWANTIEVDSADELVHCSDGGNLRGGTVLKRGDEETFNSVFEHASYLAKTRSKGNIPPGVRQYGSSNTRNKHRGRRIEHGE